VICATALGSDLSPPREGAAGESLSAQDFPEAVQEDWGLDVFQVPGLSLSHSYHFVLGCGKHALLNGAAP